MTAGAVAADRPAVVRPRRVLLGLMTLTMVTGVVGSLGAPLVPAIAEREGVSLAAAQWALTVTLLVGAVATPVIGRLGAGRRRRPVMLACLALVAFGTLLSALPLGFGAMLTGRALQGVAFGISALAIAVARDVLPPDRTTAGIAGISVAQVVSAGLGFPVAALLADLLGVKGAFGAGLVLTVAALLVGVLLVPAAEDTPTGRVDWLGAALLTVGLLGILLAVSWRPSSPAVLLLAALSLAVLAGATVWLLRGEHPLVDLRVAARPGAFAANLAAFVAGTGMYLMMSTVMILVQAGAEGGYGLGESVTVSGLMLVPYALGSIAGNAAWVRLDRRIAADRLLTTGCLGLAVSSLLLVVWHDQVWQLVVVMAVGGISGGAVFNAIPRLLVGAVPAAETGSAMGFNMVLRFVGFSLGSALSVAVLGRLADAAGRPSESGYVVVAVTGLALSAGAALCCHVSAVRGAGRRRRRVPLAGSGRGPRGRGRASSCHGRRRGAGERA